MVRKKFYFDDVFADMLLVHTLNHAAFKGAEIGECLAAAAQVVEGDAGSWRRAWQEQGEKAEAAGRQADDRGHGVSAREAYLRAVTYYYHACLAIGVDDPDFRAGVEHYRSLFQRFAALSTPAIEVIGIPYQDTRLPAYFLRPDASGQPHPTVIIGDNTAEELYYWVGPPGVQRGYNVLLVDLPGMGLNTFHGLYFRPDTEVAIGACIDYLDKRGDVDPARIAFYGGGEPGGWVAVRAAAREPRIAACVADPYVADSDAILSVFHRPAGSFNALAPAEATALSFAERGVRVSVVRCPLTVHGEGDHGFIPGIIGIARDKGVSAYVGDGANRWCAVHRLDAAQLFRLAVEEAPAGTRLHAVADEAVPFRDIAAVIGRHLDLPVTAISRAEAEGHFTWMAPFAMIDSPASSALTQKRFGWQPAHPGLIADLDEGHYFTSRTIPG